MQGAVHLKCFDSQNCRVVGKSVGAGDKYYSKAFLRKIFRLFSSQSLGRQLCTPFSDGPESQARGPGTTPVPLLINYHFYGIAMDIIGQ